MYAILHSRGYRARYAASLRRDFPKIPPTFSVRLREHLWRAGRTHPAAHGPHTDARRKLELNHLLVRRIQCASRTGIPEVRGRSNSHQCEYIPRRYAEQDWNFRVGNYRVCEKWLKDRRGAVLTADDLASYKAVVDPVVASGSSSMTLMAR